MKTITICGKEEVEVNDDGYVEIGFASQILKCQDQYISRYVNPRFSKEYPQVGEGLNIIGDLDDYHFIYIHIDDFEEFIKRIRKAKNQWV